MTETAPPHRQIVAHYERCLALHGDNHRGVDWPRAEDAELRYAVMLGVIASTEPRPIRLLDFGCGAGHLLEYIRRLKLPGISYHGLDLSERFLSVCRSKFPDVPFTCTDVLEAELEVTDFDYIVMNGVFTEKRESLIRMHVAVPAGRAPSALAACPAGDGLQRDVEAGGLGARRSVPPLHRSPHGLLEDGAVAPLPDPP